MSKRNVVQRQALEALAQSPDGLKATRLAEILWPGRVRTQFAAGAVLYHLRKREWTRAEDGVHQITTAGADRLAEILESAASAPTA